MIIYLVEEWCGTEWKGSWEVEAAFSTEQKAKEYVERRIKEGVFRSNLLLLSIKLDEYA